MYEPSDEVKRYAKRINSDPAFMAVLEALIEMSNYEFQATNWEEDAKRRNAWYVYNTTHTIAGIMASWASQAED